MSLAIVLLRINDFIPDVIQIGDTNISTMLKLLQSSLGIIPQSPVLFMGDATMLLKSTSLR